MFVLVGDGDTVVTTMVIESSGIAISRSGSSPEDLFNYYSIRSVAVDRKKKGLMWDRLRSFQSY